MFWLGFIVVIESFIVGFCVWGFLHEKTLMKWERKQFKKIKKAIQRKKLDICVKWLSDMDLHVVKDETK